MRPEIEVFDDAASLAANAAQRVVALAERAIAERGEFAVCASGGRTPRDVYERLAAPELANRIDWRRTRIYFGDERCVLPSDPASNYRMLKLALLDHVPIPAGNVFRIPTETTPDADARTYESTLRASRAARGFDLVLAGMGSDGHTASLFPGSAPELERWTGARQHPTDRSWRITLTEPVLNRTAAALFLVTGSDKAERLAEVLEGPRDELRLPAQRIQPEAGGTLAWFLDRAAAARLTRP